MDLRLAEADQHHVASISDYFNEVNVLDQENVVDSKLGLRGSAILRHRDYRVNLNNQVFSDHKD